MNVTRRQFAAAASSLLAGCRATGPDAPGGTPDHPSVERWRADFPALQQTVDGGRLAYLDSAATTHRPYAVIRALSEYYAHQREPGRDNAQPRAAVVRGLRAGPARRRGVSRCARSERGRVDQGHHRGDQ